MAFAYDTPPFAETMAILTRSVTGQDGDGNDVYGTTEIPTTGVFAPQGSSELVQGQELVLTHPTVYLSSGVAVPSPTDKMRVHGVVYDVDGTPQVFLNPFTGGAPGPVVKLVEVTG